MIPRNPTDPVIITLQAQQWNTVLAALMEAPWRHADPIIRAISTQAEQQPEAEAALAPPVKPNGAGEAHAAAA